MRTNENFDTTENQLLLSIGPDFLNYVKFKFKLQEDLHEYEHGMSSFQILHIDPCFRTQLIKNNFCVAKHLKVES